MVRPPIEIPTTDTLWRLSSIYDDCARLIMFPDYHNMPKFIHNSNNFLEGIHTSLALINLLAVGW